MLPLKGFLDSLSSSDETNADPNQSTSYFSEHFNQSLNESHLQNQDPLNFCDTIPGDTDDTWLHTLYMMSQNQCFSESSLINSLFNKNPESFNMSGQDAEQIVTRIYKYLETNKKNSLTAAVALTFQVCQYLNEKLNRASPDDKAKMKSIWEGILKKYPQEAVKSAPGFPLEMAMLLATGKTSFSQMQTILQTAGMTCLPVQNQPTFGRMPVSLCVIQDLFGNPQQGIKITIIDGEERHILVLPFDLPDAIERSRKEIDNKDQTLGSDYFQAFGAICSLFLNSLEPAEDCSVEPVPTDWMIKQMHGLKDLAVCCMSQPASETAIVGYLLYCFERTFNQDAGDIPLTNLVVFNFPRVFASAPTSTVGRIMLENFKLLMNKGPLNLSKSSMDREFATVSGDEDNEDARQWPMLRSLAKVLALHHENYANQLAYQLWIENAKLWGSIKRDEVATLGKDILHRLPKSMMNVSLKMICGLCDSQMLSLPDLCDYLKTCKNCNSCQGKTPKRTQSNLASLQKVTCKVLETEIKGDKKISTATAAKAADPILWLIKSLFVHDQPASAIELLKAAMPLLVRADTSNLGRLILDYKDQLNSESKSAEWQTLAREMAVKNHSAKEKNSNDFASETIQAMKLLTAFEIYDADLWRKVLAMASKCKNPTKLQILEEFIKIGDKLSGNDNGKEAALCWKEAFSILHSVKQPSDTNPIWLKLLEKPEIFTKFLDIGLEGFSEIRSSAYPLFVDACIPIFKNMIDKHSAKTSTLAATLVVLRNKINDKDLVQDTALLNLLLDIYLANKSPTGILDLILGLSAEIDKSNETFESNFVETLKKLFKLIAVLENQAPLAQKRQSLLETTIKMTFRLDDPAIDHKSYLNFAKLIKPHAIAIAKANTESQSDVPSGIVSTASMQAQATLRTESSLRAVTICGNLLLKASGAIGLESKKQKTKALLNLTTDWQEIITLMLKLKTSHACKIVEEWLGNDVVAAQFDEKPLNDLYRNLVSELLLLLEAADLSGPDRKNLMPVLGKIQKYFIYVCDDFEYSRDLIKRIVALAIKLTPIAEGKDPIVEEMFQQCEMMLDTKLNQDFWKAQMRPVISNVLDLEYIDLLFKELKTGNLHAEQFYRSGARRLNILSGRKMFPKLLRNPIETLRNVIALVDYFIFDASPVRWQAKGSEMTSGEDFLFHEEQASALMKACHFNGFYKHNTQDYCMHHQCLANTWPNIPFASDAVVKNLCQKLLARLIKLGNACYIEKAFSVFVRSQAILSMVKPDESVPEYDKLLVVCAANPVRLIGRKTILEMAFQSIIDAEATHSSSVNHSRTFLMLQFIVTIGNIISVEQQRPEPDFDLQLEWVRRACQYMMRALDERLYSNLPARTIWFYVNIVHLLDHIKESQRLSFFLETHNCLINLLEKASKLEINDEMTLKQVLSVMSRIADNIPLPTNHANRELFGRFLSLLTALNEYDKFQDILENQLQEIIRKIYSRCFGNENLGITIETMLISSGLLVVDSDYDDDDVNNDDDDENEIIVNLDNKNRASGNVADYTSGSDSETDS